ncbi:HNH endonuclease [Agathobaculum sp. NTUH-O15-33]|uniref:HNH endonuclease n=1 Tax=Agathobaculum sp. NTUH-O15-33 TaxID=3079302 RepID=UPI0029583830|nr:HNH endonuclease [Agathobaculum sp. NTUH-O15-33]WNX85774.1 HNH endonuclease [Agathobaculum sp. NTUH-O15-33]
MPTASKPLRPCRHPGCAVLVRGGYCDQHRPPERRSEQSRAWHSWYSLPIWTDDLRPTQLLQEPFCRECAAHGRRRVQATDVDHIVDHQGDWARFTDRSNLQSLCHSCHSRKTMAQIIRKRAKKSCR